MLQEENIEMAKIEAKSLWEQILTIMVENFLAVSFETWIEPCKTLAFKENKLLLEIENELIREML